MQRESCLRYIPVRQCLAANSGLLATGSGAFDGSLCVEVLEGKKSTEIVDC